MFDLKPVVRGISLAFGGSVALLAAAGSALAQQTGQQPPAQQEQALERAVVTGTRIQSQTITASSPVAEINQEEFKVTGATRVDDLLNQMPQLAPYFDSFNNNGATGYPTASLRQLGDNRTLVLINGQRVQPGTAFAVDLSQVPAGLVKRVDILTGGASAVYGADAVAGVVNFILDDQFEGFKINAGWSAYQHDNNNSYVQSKMDARGFTYPTGNSGFDGKSRNIDLIWGSRFADGAGHATAWLTWRMNDPLFQRQRDYSSCALNAAGTACGGSPTAPNPNFFVTDNGGSYDDFAHLTSTGTWAAGLGSLYNFAPINYYQRPENRVNFGASLNLKINEHVRPFLDVMFTNRTNSIQVAESGTFFNQELNLDCTDPLVGTMCSDLGLTGPLTVLVGKRNVEGGPRNFETKDNSYRAVFGAKGSISHVWSYNVAGILGRTDSSEVGINDLLSDRVEAALLGCPPGSFAGCIPYNVWVPNGVTKAAADALAGTRLTNSTSKLTSINGHVTGNLGVGLPSAGGEPVSLVAGAEWRKEQYSFIADSNSQAGNFTGAGGPALPLSGSTEVNELYLESAVPLLKRYGVIDNLNLDLGYRYSDYKLSGSTDTYKLGFGMRMMDNYRIRGGYNRAIRAANISELFSLQQIALWSGSDPCAGPTPEFTAAQCANTGVTPAQYGSIPSSPASQYNQFIGGNQNLKPEQADTYTIGFAATPLRNLEIAADYFDIRLNDRIGTIGASTILRLCGQTGDATLCNLVKRRPGSGDLWVGSDPSTSGYVTNLTQNFGKLRVRGIDLNARYSWNMFGGRATASLVGTRELQYKVEPLPGVNDAAAYDCKGLINESCQNPKWRHIAAMRYSRDWWRVNLRWRYYGSMDYRKIDGTPGTTDKLLVASGNRLPSYNWYDLSGTFQVGEMLELTVGVNNITDKEPPITGSTLTSNANSPGGYDQAGRFFFASMTMRF
jgi:outer membrane receptor protein involved in Fe transport